MALVFSGLIHATPSTSIFFSFCHAALWQRQEVLTVAALCHLLSFLLLYLWGRAQRLTCTGDSTCSTLLYLEFFYLSPFASASQRRCSAEQRAEFERKGVNRTTSVHLGTDWFSTFLELCWSPLFVCKILPGRFWDWDVPTIISSSSNHSLTPRDLWAGPLTSWRRLLPAQ